MVGVLPRLSAVHFSTARAEFANRSAKVHEYNKPLPGREAAVRSDGGAICDMRAHAGASFDSMNSGGQKPPLRQTGPLPKISANCRPFSRNYCTFDHRAGEFLQPNVSCGSAFDVGALHAGEAGGRSSYRFPRSGCCANCRMQQRQKAVAAATALQGAARRLKP